MPIVILLEKIIISLGISVLAVLLFLWSMPETFFLRRCIHKVFGKYIFWAGLDTYWSLFAPHPVSKNFLISFEIEFSDGTCKPYQLPEYYLLKGYQATTHFRYIKLHNQLLSQNDSLPKEAICNFIHRSFLLQFGTDRVIEKVHILRFYKPEKRTSPLALPWLSQRVFTYSVVLKKAAV